MKTSEWIIQATQLLKTAGIPSARLDVFILLEDNLGKDRASLLAHPETALTGAQEQKLSRQLQRRSRHEPLAYIRNKSEFYGRKFYINKDVLQPRAESETIISLLKRLPPTSGLVADIGTGSGCLAVTAKLELPSNEVIAVDIDPACLRVARKNAQLLGANVRFYTGDLLKPLLGKPAIILANLPYVPEGFQINQAAMHEPKLALFGGKDGLDVYRRLFEQIKGLTVQPKYILTEALPFQHEALRNIALATNYQQQEVDDLIQCFRQDT